MAELQQKLSQLTTQQSVPVPTQEAVPQVRFMPKP